MCDEELSWLLETVSLERSFYNSKPFLSSSLGVSLARERDLPIAVVPSSLFSLRREVLTGGGLVSPLRIPASFDFFYGTRGALLTMVLVNYFLIYATLKEAFFSSSGAFRTADCDVERLKLFRSYIPPFTLLPRLIYFRVVECITLKYNL